MKYHLIHTHWRFSLPATYLTAFSQEQRIQSMFWENSFTYNERMINGTAALVAELEMFVERVRPYPRWRLSADRQFRKAQNLTLRAINKARRMVNPAGVPTGA